MPARSAPTVQVPAEIATVAWNAPLGWLSLAWGDLRRAPAASLTFGAGFAAAGTLIATALVSAGLAWLWPLVMALLLMLGPVLAMGFYEVSRSLERGRRPDLDDGANALTANGGEVAAAGLVLFLWWFGWALAQSALFALFFAQAPAEPSLAALLAHPNAWPFLGASTVLAGLACGLVFALTAVSLPMLLDREVDVVRALATSLSTVRRNPGAMALWAILIGLLTSFGFATYMAGLVVTMPLLGHASWHAYRALVRPRGLLAC